MVAILLLVLAACSGQQSWQTQSKDIETIMIGISFVNQTHGWVPGDENGVGALFLSTNDGGSSWKPCPHDGYVTLPMGIAMQKLTDGTINGVIGGLGFGRNFSSMEYTPDGKNFHAPPDYTNLFGESQDAKVVNGLQGAFGITGQYTDDKGKNYNGVTISYDGGKTWTNFDVGMPLPLARYGHFPSATVWYLALGDFPSDVSIQEDLEPWTQKVYLNKRAKRAKVQDPARNGRKLLQTGAGYAAAISKTADGGKTWTTVFNDTGNFYFNDIDCPTTTDCWAVGESGTDSPQPGIRIIHSADGGANWDVQLYIANGSYSLMDIFMLNATTGWACGGIFFRGITGTFYLTNDGGKTWQLAQTLTDEYATAMSFVQPTGSLLYYGWATAFTREGLSSVLAYK